MRLEIADFGRSARAIESRFAEQWGELEQALLSMPLHVKSSDQRGIQGTLIFDPIGTNRFLVDRLSPPWHRLLIPAEHREWGTDVDLAYRGVLLEVQFSNYPFLVNNLLRAVVLRRAGVLVDGFPIGVVVVVTKTHEIPASQSTLYYEQAVRQTSALVRAEVLPFPIRLVGVGVPVEQEILVTRTQYLETRHSRTVVNQEVLRASVVAPRTTRGRMRLEIR
jgi:hypothetical protein